MNDNTLAQCLVRIPKSKGFRGPAYPIFHALYCGRIQTSSLYTVFYQYRAEFDLPVVGYLHILLVGGCVSLPAAATLVSNALHHVGSEWR